jgi:CubicO group peptidase (beta-lactamase class C family)
LAFANPPDLVEPGVVNTTGWRQAEIPASNGYATARALAGLYDALARGRTAGGPRLLSASTVEGAVTERRRGPDLVLGAETAFASGFMLPSPLRPFGRGARSFGHPGAGGALGFADLSVNLGFGYVPNQTIAAMEGGDPRWRRLIDAVYACLGRAGGGPIRPRYTFRPIDVACRRMTVRADTSMVVA